jgi:hypothetical protein
VLNVLIAELAQLSELRHPNPNTEQGSTQHTAVLDLDREYKRTHELAQSPAALDATKSDT